MNFRKINDQKGAPAYLHIYNEGSGSWTPATSDDLGGAATNENNKGTEPIPQGVGFLNVTGLSTTFEPSFFELSMINPSGNGVIVANQRAGTQSSTGFIADFSANIPTSGYFLGWKAV